MTFNDQVGTESIVVQGGVASAAVVFLHNTFISMIPYILVSLVLILADLYFGIKAAMHRGEEVRLSRAARRTVGKAFEYAAWVILASTLAVAFEAKWVAWAILGVVMGVELVSIITNYLEIHGKRIVGLNVFKIIGDKVGTDLSDVKIIDTGSDRPRDSRGRFVKREDGK